MIFEEFKDSMETQLVICSAPADDAMHRPRVESCLAFDCFLSFRLVLSCRVLHCIVVFRPALHSSFVLFSAFSHSQRASQGLSFTFAPRPCFEHWLAPHSRPERDFSTTEQGNARKCQDADKARR